MYLLTKFTSAREVCKPARVLKSFYKCFLTRKSHANLEEICLTGNVPKRFNFAHDVFDRHVAKSPSNVALWMESERECQRWTFAQLHRESVRASIALRNVIQKSRHVLENDPPVILTVLPRVPQWWFLYLGTIRIGAVFCPGPTQLSPTDIQYRLEASGASVVITDAPNMWKVEEATKKGKVKNRVQKIVVGDSLGAEGWIELNDLIDDVLDAEVLAFRGMDTKSEGLAQIFFTSGTTGYPKMVGHTHASYGAGHSITSFILDLNKNDVMWNISDPGWAKSSYSSFFAPWIAGATIYINRMERFEPQKVLKVLREVDITTLCAPPTLYRFMTQENDASLFKFKTLRNCFGSGEAVNPEVSRKWELRTGLPIHQFYGQTETVSIGVPPSHLKKEGSIGKPVVLDLRIVDDDGNDLGANKEGMIALKVKPQKPVGMFKGYIRLGSNGLEINSEINCYVSDYYTTGDRGYVDDDGQLFIIGRADDVINSAGYRIGPYEVESVLLQHPSVAESAVVGYPDEERGEVVKAFIVLSEQYRERKGPALIEEIQDFVKRNTAPYKYPRLIEFVDVLPKNVSGKILRRELRRVGQKSG